MVIFFVFWFIFCFGLAIICIAAQWKVFEKAGQPGWAAIVPIYTIYILTKIVGKPGYWTALMFVPFLNFIIGIWLVNMLSKSFGKDENFTVGLIFLGFVFLPILGFSNNIRYIGPYGDPAAFRAAQDAGNRFDFERQ